MTDNMSDEEIDRRYNHWTECKDNISRCACGGFLPKGSNQDRCKACESVSRCKRCGSFIPTQEPEHGKVVYHCKGCDRHIMEWVGKRTQKATP